MEDTVTGVCFLLAEKNHGHRAPSAEEVPGLQRRVHPRSWPGTFPGILSACLSVLSVAILFLGSGHTVKVFSSFLPSLCFAVEREDLQQG